MGGPNYAQFGNRVHAGRANVRAEADHANRADNLLVGRVDWKDEMSWEELLATRVKSKGRFDQTHRLRSKKIEEGDWVLVYENNLDNQHKAMWRFARRWFGPYVVTSANDNGTYHLVELDGTRMAVPVAGKRVKAFKCHN